MLDVEVLVDVEVEHPLVSGEEQMHLRGTAPSLRSKRYVRKIQDEKKNQPLDKNGCTTSCDYKEGDLTRKMQGTFTDMVHTAPTKGFLLFEILILILI